MAIIQQRRVRNMRSARAERARGFALLIAVIFMSVMLTFGLALGSLSYKQQILASSAIESQYAFYASDAGLECALYQDQQQGLFAYASAQTSIPTFSCDGSTPYEAPTRTYFGPIGNSTQILTYRFSLSSNTRCVDLTIYKPQVVGGANKTYLFSQGYDVACSVVVSPQGARFVARGLEARY